ncbi:MAG: uracil-DNA glycosylase family protein [Planctomycetota bacterium]
MGLIEVDRELARQVDDLSFPEPITHVYNPLVYARRPHEKFIKKYARKGTPALLLGMNPGPWGMAQTGIPFGEIELARDWLDVAGKVDKPDLEHPKRPIEGFDCTRSEVSGRRLWGWAQEYFTTPEAFFERFYVLNYCPLVFMEESGRNFTPDKLPAAAKKPLFEACDEALRKSVKWLKPRIVIGVGKFAEKRAIEVLGDLDLDLEFGTVLHPSPASPIANRGWAPQAEAQLEKLGVLA